MLVIRNVTLHADDHVHIVCIFIVCSSDISRWPGFELLPMDTSLNHKYERSYYISSHNQHYNRGYCHQTGDYRIRLRVWFLWG